MVFPLVLRSVRVADKDSPVGGCLQVYAAVGPGPPGHDLHQGDVVRLLGRLTVPGAPTNPREIPLSLSLAHRGFCGMVHVPDPGLLHRIGHEMVPWHVRATDAARTRVITVLRQSMPGAYGPIYADLLGSILFGLKAAPLPPALVDIFRRCGTIHILVVSGTQISLLFTVVWLPGALAALYRRRRGLVPAEALRGPPQPDPGALALGVALTAAYAVFVGGGSPVWRAGIGAVLAAAALGLSQMRAVAEQHPLEIDKYTLIAVAAFVLLLQRPTELFNPGFQLSFAAVLGLAYLAPRIATVLRGLPRWLGLSLAASTGVQLAVLPVQAWHFGQVSLMGFAGNLVAVPLAAALLALGLTACALGLAWLPAAKVINYANASLLGWLVHATALMAEMPGASVTYRLASPWPAVFYFAAVAAAARWAGRWAQAAEDRSMLP